MDKLFGKIEDLVIYKSKEDMYKGIDATIPRKIILGEDSLIDTKAGPLKLKNVFNIECKNGKLLIEAENCFVIFLPNKLK